MNKKILLVFLFSLILAIPAYSQEKDTTVADSTWDNWDNNAEDKWDSKWDDKWDKIGSHMFDFRIKGAPTIQFNYGASKMNLKSISDKFTKPGLLELKLGYTTDKSYNGSDYVTKYKFKYLHVGNFTANLSGNQNGPDIMTNIWRFGLGTASGFGYDLGKGFGITPYYQSSFDWTIVNVQSTPHDSLTTPTTNLFNKKVRFGNSFQGGIQVKLTDNLGLDASYERSIIYPRHLFWKWGISELIESIGQGLVDKFVEEVLDSSPSAVPIVNFLLKNALSYGLYELRQDKMNWPFETVPPLALDQFKIGISFVL
jgi:hypothetical protein